MEAKRRGRRPGSRNYEKAFREMVVAEANDPSRSIAEVAQAHGLNASMVAQWRRQARACSPESTVSAPASVELLPVDVVEDASGAALGAASPIEVSRQAYSQTCEIDIEVGGRRVRIRGVTAELAERFLLGCLK